MIPKPRTTGREWQATVCLVGSIKDLQVCSEHSSSNHNSQVPRIGVTPSSSTTILFRTRIAVSLEFKFRPKTATSTLKNYRHTFCKPIRLRWVLCSSKVIRVVEVELLKSPREKGVFVVEGEWLINKCAKEFLRFIYYNTYSRWVRKTELKGATE